MISLSAREIALLVCAEANALASALDSRLGRGGLGMNQKDKQDCTERCKRLIELLEAL